MPDFLNLTYHITTGIVAVTASLGLMQMVTPPNQPQIVVVDGQESVLKFIESIGNDMGEEAYKASIAGFSTDMDVALAAIARDNNLIILNAKAVLAGAHNITEPVVTRVLAQ